MSQPVKNVWVVECPYEEQSAEYLIELFKKLDKDSMAVALTAADDYQCERRQDQEDQ